MRLLRISLLDKMGVPTEKLGDSNGSNTCRQVFPAETTADSQSKSDHAILEQYGER